MRLLRRIEWVEPETLFQTDDNERETQRIETRLEQLEIVGQSRQLSLLLQGDLFKLRGDCSPNGHSYSRISCFVFRNYTGQRKGFVPRLRLLPHESHYGTLSRRQYQHNPKSVTYSHTG